MNGNKQDTEAADLSRPYFAQFSSAARPVLSKVEGMAATRKLVKIGAGQVVGERSSQH